MTKRKIAMGDIHGCSNALATVLNAVQPGPEDTLVTLGDVIDRGPDTRGVLDQLIRLQDRCRLVPLMGNHEEMLLGAREGRSDLQSWLRFGGREALDSYGPNARLKNIPRRHWEFIESCRPFYETETHLFVHANYWPNLPLNQTPSSTLLWENLDLERVRPHYSGNTVVVGHTPQDEDILDLGFLVCLDTRCGFGGWLTALDLGSGHFWQATEQGKVRMGQRN